MARAALNPIVRNLRKAVAAQRFDALPDGELLECFRTTTDPATFEAIVRRYGERVLAACHKVLTEPADVEDAFQATFLVLLRDAPCIRKGYSLGGFLYGVAHRIALQARARAARRARAEGRKTPRTEEAAPDLSWREACGILHEELDRLPDSYRLPLLLCYLEGKSRDEAARQLGVKIDVLRGRLERGRDRLRSRLIKRGITLTAGLLAAVEGTAQAGPLSTRLVQATVEAISTGSTSATVHALVQGTMTTMIPSRFKLAAVALLVVGLISGGVGWRMHAAPATEPDPAPEPAALAAGQPTEPGKNAAVKPVPISGRVVGRDGKPVPNAKLFVFDSEGWRPAPQPTANPDGKFAFALPPDTDRQSYPGLFATAPDLGLGGDWAGVAVTAPSKEVVLKLPQDEPVRGRVVDLEGRPVSGATVTVTDLATGADDTLNEWVRLWAKDWEQQYKAYSTLTTGRWLYVKKAATPFFQATTDADGHFTLAGIGRDRCPHLTVRARGKATQVCIVALRPDFHPAPSALTGSRVFGPEFTLPLVPAVRIVGMVRDAVTRKPLAGVRILGQVDLRGTSVSGYLVLPDIATVTDAEGKYGLDGLPITKQYVLVADPKRGDGPVHRFAVRKDETLGVGPLTADFDLPRGVVLTGHLKDRKTGKPVLGHVFYRPLWSNKWVEDHPDYTFPGIAPMYTDADGFTDANGRFQLTVLPGPGILHVHALEGEYRKTKLAPEDDNDEILLEEGSGKVFKTSGQGGHFSPSHFHAYRVLRIPADARSFSADVTLEPEVDRSIPSGPDPAGRSTPVSGTSK
jgi:RNA polymerase sigma factor (sigma-70 family)